MKVTLSKPGGWPKKIEFCCSRMFYEIFHSLDISDIESNEIRLLIRDGGSIKINKCPSCGEKFVQVMK